MNIKRIDWIAALLLVSPLIYFYFSYDRLPAQLPIHWGFNGKPNGWVEKDHAWETLLLTAFLPLGVYLLLRSITKIDPKKRTAQSQKVFNQVGFAAIVFFTVVNFAILIGAQSAIVNFSPFMLVIASLLLAFIGNIMHNLRPNYFMGIRTPWTLENETIWKETHRFASKLWFGGGLLAALLTLLLPSKFGVPVFMGIVGILAVVPIAYSFLLFKRSQNTQS